MKKCNKCNKKKSADSFYVRKTNKDWLRYLCKSCEKEKDLKYRKTQKGLFSKIYSGQITSSKNRWHGLPNYTKEEMSRWIREQDNFTLLRDNWVGSWYKRLSVPSVDRIDDYKWYSLDNIQLVTWWKNQAKWHSDRKNWINNKYSKAVKQFSKDWEIIKEFYSINKAYRETWVAFQSISAVCLWKRKTAWWFKREYSIF